MRILFFGIVCVLLMGCAKEEQRNYKKITIAYDQYPETLLDVYVPITSMPVKAYPVVVYIHGGGWDSGDKSQWESKVPFFSERRYVSVSINYRLSPSVTHPTHIEDVSNALNWICDNISSYGGDPNYLILIGHSAGAHLALLAVTNQKYIQQAGVNIDCIKDVYSLDIGGYLVMNELIYDNVSLLPRIYAAIGSNKENDAWVDFAPYNFVAADKYIPRITLIYSDDMYRYKANTIFKEKLDECGVNNRTYILPSYSHYDVMANFPQYNGEIYLF